MTEINLYVSIVTINLKESNSPLKERLTEWIKEHNLDVSYTQETDSKHGKIEGKKIKGGAPG